MSALSVAPLGLLAACGGSPPEGGGAGGAPRNVLVVTLDTTRADRIGCYGYAGAATPTIDALARRGVLFETSYTPSVLTLPSHATIFTGLLPPSHAVRNNGTDRLGAGARTMAEILSEAGYRTGAFVGAAVLEAMHGLDQGFAAYDDVTAKEVAHTVRYAERDAAAVTDAAPRWLAGVHGPADGPSRRGGSPATAAGPWMLWVHYFDPHAPYDPPDSLRARFAGRGYDGEIAWVDQNLGRLLRAVEEGGGAGRTIVVVVADHGEGLGDHGEQSHGVFLYDETVRVPLILSAPGLVPEGTRVGELVRTTDILPTILDLLGLGVPAGLDGISLRPLIEGRVSALALPAYSEAVAPALMYGWSPLASLRLEGWKYIHAPRPELFDLTADPGERRDRFPEERDLGQAMRRTLEEILKQSGARAPRSEGVRLTSEQTAALRSLGYVSGGDQLPLRQALDEDPLALLEGGARGLADPKDRTALLARIQEALQAYGQGRLEEAIGFFRRILQESPGSNFVRLFLAGAYRRLDELEPALAEYREIIARQPEEDDAWLGAGWTLMRLERFGEARAAYERVLAINPRHSDALSSLASLHFIQGDIARAEALYRQVLEQRPGEIRTTIILAQILEARGAAGEAEALYRRALAAEKGDAAAALGLAHMLHRSSRSVEALKVVDEAAALHPGRADLRVARGEIDLDLGRLDEAGREFGAAVSMAPRAPQGYHGLARVALRRGDAREARRLFMEALRIDPGFEDARRELARLGPP